MIIFTKITFANFLSVGNTPVSIDLNQSKTTLLHGTNGSGKSTVLDALCYALFNKPFRKVNLPQLINTQNKKGLLVEVEFTIGKHNFMVRRGIKKKVFEVWKDGEMLDKQAADKDNQAHLEQNILKLSYKSFCQVCILGSANYMPFMALPTPARRDCVEDFLDIKVFSSMALLAKERLRGLKDALRDTEGDLGNVNFKLDVINEKIEEVKAKEASDTQELKDELKQISEQIESKRILVQRVECHRNNIVEFRDRLNEKKPQEKSREVHKMIAKLESKTERLEADNKFYEDNDTCPTCTQTIAEEVKSHNFQTNESLIQKNILMFAEGQKVLENMSSKIRILDNRERHIRALNITLNTYQVELENLESRGKRLVEKLRDIENERGTLDREIGKQELLIADKARLSHRKDELFADVRNHDVVVNLLKDGGIKAQVVRKYLPVMNKLIRTYLTELDLPLHFKLDEEFNETVASPLHQDFSYASFSEGQKARIDLSLMFTWREIGKLKNSVSTNLLILDEVFSSSLDETGKELLLALLRYKLDDNQNILVVDHTLSGEFKAKFHRTIEVQRIKGFSQYSGSSKDVG